ncbi:hypothetical protein RUND412_003886 [Rhizina undulata]
MAVKADKIRAAWPNDGSDIPTTRAISERIVRIQNAVKAMEAADTPNTHRKRKSTSAPDATPKRSKQKRIPPASKKSELMEAVRGEVKKTAGSEKSKDGSSE